MPLTLTIGPKSRLAKQKPDIAFFRKKFSPAYQIGGVGPYFSFLPEPEAPPADSSGEYMVFAGGPLGRGFYMSVDKDYHALRLTSPTPTTLHDLEGMVAFSATLAELLQADEVECDGLGPVRVPMLVKVFPQLKAENCQLLQNQAINRPGFVVSGVRYPLGMPGSLCERIAKVPPESGALYFSDYLAEKQALARAYLAPQLYRGEDGAVAARYVLNENVATIVPDTPFIPYGASPFGDEPVQAWHIILNSAQAGPLGSLPYAEFLARLGERDLTDFDDVHHVLRPLSVARMQEILKGPA